MLSWGADGKLCLWDSYSEGQIGQTMSVLASNAEYPLYAVDVREFDENEDSNETSIKNTDVKRAGTKQRTISSFAVGGGRDAGFIGVPVKIYDVFSPS